MTEPRVDIQEIERRMNICDSQPVNFRVKLLSQVSGQLTIWTYSPMDIPLFDADSTDWAL
jgi:hypothetical protein